MNDDSTYSIDFIGDPSLIKEIILRKIIDNDSQVDSRTFMLYDQ